VGPGPHSTPRGLVRSPAAKEDFLGFLFGDPLCLPSIAADKQLECIEGALRGEWCPGQAPFKLWVSPLTRLSFSRVSVRPTVHHNHHPHIAWACVCACAALLGSPGEGG
jgi:hypothetical protein